MLVFAELIASKPRSRSPLPSFTTTMNSKTTLIPHYMGLMVWKSTFNGNGKWRSCISNKEFPPMSKWRGPQENSRIMHQDGGTNYLWRYPPRIGHAWRNTCDMSLFPQSIHNIYFSKQRISSKVSRISTHTFFELGWAMQWARVPKPTWKMNYLKKGLKLNITIVCLLKSVTSLGNLLDGALATESIIKEANARRWDWSTIGVSLRWPQWCTVKKVEVSKFISNFFVMCTLGDRSSQTFFICNLLGRWIVAALQKCVVVFWVLSRIPWYRGGLCGNDWRPIQGVCNKDHIYRILLGCQYEVIEILAKLMVHILCTFDHIEIS